LAKWADYCISAVTYDRGHSLIVKASVCEDKGDALGGASEWTRAELIATLDIGRTFVTIWMGKDGMYKKGEEVGIVSHDGVMYIRTDENNIAADHLGNMVEG